MDLSELNLDEISDDDLVLGLSKFLPLPQLPQKFCLPQKRLKMTQKCLIMSQR
jgi:hypothetical protein